MIDAMQYGGNTVNDIHVLSQDTVNKIAAGEVVERPSSVVKEMVENAIDANSSMITVEIKDGGESLIRVTDNGSGISFDNVMLAFTPHATSKIIEANDLNAIKSLGFRGEALASIDSVSQMEMLSKTRDSFVGTRYSSKGGKDPVIEEAACPDGTTFIVRNLFFNTPARQKFLKKPQTEAGYISDLLERMALSHPDIGIRFINQSQTKMETVGNGSLKDAIFRVYGREVASNLLEVDYENDEIKIDGFIGKPSINRGNRKFMIYFINGRYIQSNVIQKAVQDAFAPYIMLHKFPFCVLNIEVDPTLTDVNVHPQKMEIRFQNGQEVYRAVYHAVKNSIEGVELIPKIDINGDNKKAPTPEPKEERRLNDFGAKSESAFGVNGRENGGKIGSFGGQTEKTSESIKSRSVTDNQKSFWHIEDKPSTPKMSNFQQVQTIASMVKEEADFGESKDKEGSFENASEGSFENASEGLNVESSEETREMPIPERVESPSWMEIPHPQQMGLESIDETFMQEKAIKECKIIGQVFLTYWIIEYEGNMYIIDQHAAHEKVNYERFMAKITNNEVTTQEINPPVIVTLSLLEQAVLKEHMEDFNSIGFEIEEFGGNEYAITGVPDNIPEISKEELFLEMMDSLTSESGNLSSKDFKMRVATMSCKAAVKGNNKLDLLEVKKLLNELLSLENPYNCPHGRPTMIKFSQYDLDRKFKRIVD